MTPEYKNEILAVKKLGDEIGYGNMMCIASALWRESLIRSCGSPAGAFVPVLMDGVKSSYIEMVETDNQFKDEAIKSALS